MTFDIHTRMKPEIIASSLRTAVTSVDKDLPLLDIRTQNEQIEDTTKQERVFASLTNGFGLLALVLACIGIYGLWPIALLDALTRSAYAWSWERNQAGAAHDHTRSILVGYGRCGCGHRRRSGDEPADRQHALRPQVVRSSPVHRSLSAAHRRCSLGQLATRVTSSKH